MALPQDRTIALESLPAQVQKFVAPSAPVRTKVMVVQGAIPMQPQVHLLALYFLATTNDERVAELIRAAVLKLPEAQILQILKGELPAVILDWLADLFAGNDGVLSHILRNRATDPDTYVKLAGQASERLCDQIARNEALLLQAPEVIEKLYLNPKLRASVSDRMIDFAARNDLVLNIPCYAEIVEAVRGVMQAPVDQAAVAAQDALFSEVATKAVEERAADDALMSGEDEPPVAPKPPQHDEVEGGTSAARIRHMNVAQKVRLAVMGGKSDRAVLIRDSNKVVTRAVIRSPAINDTEALGYARLKSLNEEIVTFIANKQQWTRRYPMKLALVMHPKTPVALAMQFLRQLRIPDLKTVARSHGISGAVTKEARAMLKARMK